MINDLPLEKFNQKAKETPELAFLHQRTGSEWLTYSFADVDEISRKIATGLIDQGYERGDRIALLSGNSAEWVIVDLAIMMAGMVSVPIYPTAGRNTVQHVLSHSDAKAIFLGNVESAAVLEACGNVRKIALTACASTCDVLLSDWISKCAPLEQCALPEDDELMTIVYTSGSTGVPKGVGLTYRNMAAGAAVLSELYPERHNRVLSYLPLAHVAERSFCCMGALYNSVEIFFNESLESFPADLRHARVTAFISVPRLWTKFQAQVLSEISFGTLQSLLAGDDGTIVAQQIREKMGFGECKSFVSGTAPIPPSLLHWYDDIGIQIIEGWGMTETSGVACATLPFSCSGIGSIGTPVNSLEMKLSEDSEILIRGESVFSGYYLNPSANEQSFTDGWFRTGDCATIGEDGNWKIVGRVKEQFKTAKGKYVAPVPIESQLSSNPLVEQVCVMGAGQSQPFALVVPSPISSVEEAVESLSATLEATNSQLELHEKLSGVLIVETPWTVDNEMLTPTFKLKRANIENHYKSIIGGADVSNILLESQL